MKDFVTELAKVVIEYGAQIILLAVTAIFANVLSWIKTYIQNRFTHEVISESVRYVEQMYHGVTSSEKYNEAVKLASEKLGSYSIKLTSSEMKVIIEAAVNELYPKMDVKAS